MKMYGFLCLSILVLVTSFGHVHAQLFSPDESTSNVSFKIKNFGVVVNGTLGGLAGSIKVDSNDITQCAFDVTLNASSIDTGIELRDNHLRKKEYLDVATYPNMKFVSTKIVRIKTGGDVTGNLTIKDVTKVVSFPFSYSMENGLPVFKGMLEIDRRDFHVGDNSMSVGDKVTVTLRITTAKAK